MPTRSRVRPNKERFGKGAIEGVLGPGASNNSTLGGSLITTISFGIPASVFMAILIGAFIMHGVVPGPDMLRPESKGGHLGLTYSFVWIMVISNLITVGMIFLFLKQLVKVTQVRGSLLIPFILMLIYLGAFAEKNAFPDLLLVLIFGALGWILEKLKWPRPPLILGLVLGGLAESRLFLSVSNYGMSWLWRPMVLVLIAVTLFGAFYPVVKARSREEKAPWRSCTAGEGARQGGSRKEGQQVVGDLCGLPCSRHSRAGALAEQELQRSGRTLPLGDRFPAPGPCCSSSLAEGAHGQSGGRPLRTAHAEEEEPEIPAHVANRRTADMFGWIIVYFLAIWLLGFPVGGTLCSFLQLKFASKEKWPITIILTVGLWAFVYLLFERTLHVPFPPGYLLEALGWAE